MVSILLALVAAVLVGWLLLSAKDTACFRRSISVHISPPAHILRDCKPSDAFDAVRRYIQEQRNRAATDNKFVPEETDRVKARSALVAWIALLMATAGLAAVVAVRSVVIIQDLKPKPRWNARLLALCAAAAILLVLPVVVNQLLGFHLGDFDDLHKAQFRGIYLIVGLLVFPGVVALVAIWSVLVSSVELHLDHVSCLGSHIRQLVSMLGAILALSVLATAARWQAIATLPGGESAPSTVILLWGSLFALVLAVLYIPVYQRWATEARRLISDEVKLQLPGDQPLRGTVGFRSSEMSLTNELNARLGVGGALKSLQGSVAVLAPVIAATVSSLFS